jgi:trigger factor
VICSHSFIDTFEDQLIGKNIGDDVDVNVTFPEEYHDEKLKGQPAVFSIKLNEIKHRVLPELTDEFVAKSSQFKTVDELKADIQKYLDSQWEGMKKANAENTLFKTVSDSTSVEIPQGMIDREVASLKAEYQQRLSYQGVDWNKFVQSQGADFDKNLAQDATSRIKNSLIIDKISKEIDVKVEQSDFQSKISQMAGAYGVQPQELVKQFNQNPGFISSISQQIVNEKVRDFLLNNNKIVYVEMKPEEKSNKETVEA